VGFRGSRPGTSPRRRRLAATLAATVGLALAVLLPSVGSAPSGPLSAPPAAASEAAARLVGMINAARSANGLPALAVSGDLTAAAAARARVMAADGALSHTPNLGDALCCWSWLGENVGYAYSATQAHQTFMASAPHRANILAGQADQIGVAVVIRDGTLWVAEVFRGQSGGSSRTAAASQSSRSGDRTAPAAVSTGSDPSSASPSAPAADPSRSPRQILDARLHTMRQNLRAVVEDTGRFDPLRAALRYAGTLDRVTR
jgi:uncharacterized protein YkwD